MARWRILVLTLGIALSFGCSRQAADNGNSSRILIQAPGGHGKVGALSFPVNRKACYGINVTGNGIEGAAGTTCSPSTGVIAGFVEPGQQISAAVPQGSDRTLELYVYLLPENDSSSCPGMSPAFSATQLLNIYRVAKVEGLSLNKPEQVIELTAVFPGVNNHLAATFSMPATCTAAALPGNGSNPYNFHVSTGMTMATGGTYKMQGRAHGSAPAQTASGGAYKLIKK